MRIRTFRRVLAPMTIQFECRAQSKNTRITAKVFVQNFQKNIAKLIWTFMQLLMYYIKLQEKDQISIQKWIHYAIFQYSTWSETYTSGHTLEWNNQNQKIKSIHQFPNKHPTHHAYPEKHHRVTTRSTTTQIHRSGHRAKFRWSLGKRTIAGRAFRGPNARSRSTYKLKVTAPCPDSGPWCFCICTAYN